MHTAELQKFGLSEKEAKVYLALLELEVATAHEIAKASNTNRSSTYVVLESLQKRGLVSVSAGKGKKQYIVESPEKLVRLAELEARERVEVKEDLLRILPDLKSLYSQTKKKPRVRIYEGVEGLINVFENTLSSREKFMRVASSATDIQRVLPDYLPKYVELRKKLGIRMHGIHLFDPLSFWLAETGSKNFDEVHLLPPDKWTFKSDFAIVDDTIAYMMHKDLLAIEIEDPAAADAMKIIFDLAFEEAKKQDMVPKIMPHERKKIIDSVNKLISKSQVNLQ